MALIVETGTGSATADSYISAAGYQSWASSRGLTVSSVEATIEGHILRAMGYFETLSFNGYKLTRDQSLMFPRGDLVIDGYAVLTTVIPNAVVQALYELTYAEDKGYGMSNAVERQVKREAVAGVGSKEYMDNASDAKTSRAAQMWLAKLTSNPFRIVRV